MHSEMKMITNELMYRVLGMQYEIYINTIGNILYFHRNLRHFP